MSTEWEEWLSALADKRFLKLLLELVRQRYFCERCRPSCTSQHLQYVCARPCQNELWLKLSVRRWLQLRYDFDPARFDCDSAAVRLPFDCSSTALRPFDDLRHDLGLPVCVWAAVLRPKQMNKSATAWLRL